MVFVSRPYFFYNSSAVIFSKSYFPHVFLSEVLTPMRYVKNPLHLFFSINPIKSDVRASVGVSGTLLMTPPSVVSQPPFLYC